MEKISTKRRIITTALLIAAGSILIPTAIAYWWMGIGPAIIINYFYLREFYPSISTARAKRIMDDERINTTLKRIPLSSHFIKSIAQRNYHLHYQYKKHRWYLVDSEKLVTSNFIVKEKIGVKDWWLYTQICYSETYVSESKSNREKRKIERLKKQKAAKYH